MSDNNCHRCDKPIAAGNMTHDGRPWCGCAADCGMTRRDRFAMAALTGLIVEGEDDADILARESYRIADAMMEHARKVAQPEEAKPDAAADKLAEAADELFQAANHVRLNWDLPWDDWSDARGRLCDALEAYRKEAGR